MTGTVFVWKMLGMDSLFSYATRLNKRQIYRQILQFALTIATTLMLWKGLIVVTGVDSPVVVVLSFCLQIATAGLYRALNGFLGLYFYSGSMEPAFYRGDLLFLTNPQEGTIKVGDIVVFKIRGRDIPIVHRVIQLHGDGKGSIRFLTKGDNNDVDDRSLYASGQLWLQPSDIVGRVRGCFPYVGMITVLMNDNPLIKYGLLLAVAGFALIRREELSVAV